MNQTKIMRLASIFAQLLSETDPDAARGGLAETPMRAAKAWSEWVSGYEIEPSSLLKTFEDGAAGYDSLVIVHNIPVVSLCEHHLAPIEGIAHVGYLPKDRIVGLSKLARVVDAFSRRLQVQERLSVDIAACVHNALAAQATGVIIRAHHGCMSSRGVKIHGSITTTSCMLGKLREEDSLRAEFMSLCAQAENGRV